jgi:hypothetical protein
VASWQCEFACPDRDIAECRITISTGNIGRETTTAREPTIKVGPGSEE